MAHAGAVAAALADLPAVAMGMVDRQAVGVVHRARPRVPARHAGAGAGIAEGGEDGALVGVAAGEIGGVAPVAGMGARALPAAGAAAAAALRVAGAIGA